MSQYPIVFRCKTKHYWYEMFDKDMALGDWLRKLSKAGFCQECQTGKGTVWVDSREKLKVYAKLKSIGAKEGEAVKDG